MAKVEAEINKLVEYLENMAGESRSWTTHTSFKEDLAKALEKDLSTIKRHLKIILSLRIIKVEEIVVKGGYTRKMCAITILKPGSTVEKGPNFYQIKTP